MLRFNSKNGRQKPFVKPTFELRTVLSILFPFVLFLVNQLSWSFGDSLQPTLPVFDHSDLPVPQIVVITTAIGNSEVSTKLHARQTIPADFICFTNNPELVNSLSISEKIADVNLRPLDFPQ